MKTKRLFALVMFTLVCLAGALTIVAQDLTNPPNSGKHELMGALPLLITGLVPSLIAVVRYFAPKVPKPIIPWACPVLGVAIDRLAAYSGLSAGDPILGAFAGAAGNCLREAVDQFNKASVSATVAKVGVAVKLVVVSIIGASLLTGCGGLKGIYRTSATSRTTVTHAMMAWNDYVKEFHPPVERELQVKAAFEKFKAAQVAVLDTAIAYNDALNDAQGEARSKAEEKLNAASAAARVAMADLLSLLRQFGVKI